jgi:hypothetical protein
MIRILASLLLLLWASSALAQAPPAVPALPDTERRTAYSISGTTCNCAVNFALYGDGSDYWDWIEVYLNGVLVSHSDPTYGWAITSPTGPLGSIALPITDAVLNFTGVQTGTVQIVGARRPRRAAQFQENQGVAARDLNQALTDIVAQNREAWDKINDVTGRGLFSQPGNTVGPLPLPAKCSGSLLGFDGTGLNPVCVSPATGLGTVIGPGTSVVGDFALWNATNGTLLSDGGPAGTGVLTALGKAVNTSGGIATYPATVTSLLINSANYTPLIQSGALPAIPTFANASLGAVMGSVATPNTTGDSVIVAEKIGIANVATSAGTIFGSLIDKGSPVGVNGHGSGVMGYAQTSIAYTTTGPFFEGLHGQCDVTSTGINGQCNGASIVASYTSHAHAYAIGVESDVANISGVDDTTSTYQNVAFLASTSPFPGVGQNKVLAAYMINPYNQTGSQFIFGYWVPASATAVSTSDIRLDNGSTFGLDMHEGTMSYPIALPSNLGIYSNNHANNNLLELMFLNSSDELVLGPDPNIAGFAFPHLPTSATGSGGLYMCVDTNGLMYKKSACP